jgi:hypothetical protein
VDDEVSTHTFLTMIIEESVCFMSCEPILFLHIILMWYTRHIYIFVFINWTLRMSDNLPETVQILCHALIICITVLENIIICCQIFCDLLLKSAFDLQLILVQIKWHIKWKYLIKKFHNICLSYYFKYLLKPYLPRFLLSFLNVAGLYTRCAWCLQLCWVNTSFVDCMCSVDNVTALILLLYTM